MAKAHELSFPTEAHQSFVRYLCDVCKEWGVTALLKGSIAKGTVQEYSDIDVIILGKEIECVFDRIVRGYGELLFSVHFLHPSTYMVVYSNGLAVEYDIRKTVTVREKEKGVLIGRQEADVSCVEKDRITVRSEYVLDENDTTKLLGAAQMCCAKLLCKKDDLAMDIFNDRVCIPMGRASVKTREELIASICGVILSCLPEQSDLYIYFREMTDKIKSIEVPERGIVS